MPLIVGMNIHRSPDAEWRNEMSDVVEDFTVEFWGIDSSDVSCTFPHDPSVPANAVATFIVELMFEKEDRTPERRREFAQQLGARLETAVQQLRERLATDPREKVHPVRIEVACKPYNHEHNGFYITPEPEEKVEWGS